MNASFSSDGNARQVFTGSGGQGGARAHLCACPG